jgi:hypothetical protein
MSALPAQHDLRLGDWILRLWIVDASWRLTKRKLAWPYRYYSLSLGWCEVVLKYAPACILCLNDEHVLYPGKLCPWCHAAMEKRRAIVCP